MAHPSIHSAPERYKAQLLSALSLSFSLIVFGGLSVTLQLTGFSVLIAAGFLFSALSFIAYLVSRTPFYGRAALIFVAGFAFLAYVASLLGAYPALFITLTFAILFLLTNLFEVKWMALFITVNVVAALLLSALFLPQLQGQEALNVRAGLFTLGLFVLLFAWYRDNLERLRLQEVAQAQIELQQANLELQNAQREVNARLAELRLAAEVGRSVSQVRALDTMLKEAVELIRARFDLYYVQVYLTNPSQTALVLQAGTGAVGEQLLARAHKLPLNNASINGRAALEKQPVIVADTDASLVFKPNPLLPETRSEMAVPLLVGEKILGVLDMQSQRANALNAQILSAFEALAGQIAIAIQNTRLLAEAEEARAEVEKQAARLSRANWSEYLDAIHAPEEMGFVFEKNEILPVSGQAALPAENALSAPIAVSGETLGNLAVELGAQTPLARASQLVGAVARQVAQHIESLRLLENAERFRAEAEQASRRLTREGWQAYESRAGQTISYAYDLKQVRLTSGESEQNAMTHIPLKVRDEVIGSLAVQGLDENDPESLALAAAVAERLSAHVESLRQFEETQRGQMELDKRAQQLAAVAEVSTASSQELDIEKMLQKVVHLTQRKFGLYHVHVFTFNERMQNLEIQACGYREGDEHEGTHGTMAIPLMQEQSLVARAARTRQAVIVNDVRNEPGWLPNPLLPDTRSELAVPMLVGDQLLGVMDVQSDKMNAFTQEDANIQTTLASQIATALQNALSFEKAQEQAERESKLNAISQKIQSATSVEAVLQIAARELGHALGAPMTIAQLSMKEND
ncbi:MAG: hypothetical protein Fur002_02110 [Anaerolineales bacterium]